MGMTIDLVETPLPPLSPLSATRLVLVCDGCLLGTTDSFVHDDGFIGQHREAMAAGWKETFGDSRRLWLGPCCSGK